MSTGKFRYREFYFTYIDVKPQMDFIKKNGTDKDREILARWKCTKYLSRPRYEYLLVKYNKLKEQKEIDAKVPDYNTVTKEELLKMREVMKKERKLQKKLEYKNKAEKEKELFKSKCKKVEIPDSNVLVIELF